MIHSIFFGAAIAACACGVFIGCNNSNTVTPPSSDANPAAPTGATLIYSDGFGGDLSKWETNYMILVSDFYPHMKITTDAAHTGTHSLTSDSCRTALLYKLSPRLETGIAGVEYFIMAKAKGKANFVVEIGQDAGSSGGLFKAFGMGFDPTDFLKCIYYD
jgi:hypothetical protein